MRITECSLGRSSAGLSTWRFVMEINGIKFEGFFDDFGGFLTMVKECAKFMAVRHNLLRAKDAGLTRQVMPGDGNTVLPGDRGT